MKISAQKTIMAALIGVVLLTTFYSADLIAAAPGTGTPHEVDGNQYQGAIQGNESNQFRFRNRFQFQIQTNASMDIDCDVDVDAVGERDFQLELNASEGQSFKMQVKDGDSELGLENGKKVQTRKQNQYQYRNQFMVNLSLEGEGSGMQARLRVDCENPDATWAYYDEESEEWVETESEYEDGYLTTETEHFSTWTVLEPEETGIDAFPLLAAFMGIGIIGILYKSRKN